MRLLALLVMLFLQACAHGVGGKSPSPEALWGKACQPGSKTQSVRGSVWMKAKSKDASGQFPANVKADSPDQLDLEVTNLIGSTQALIHVNAQKYEVVVPEKDGQRAEKRLGRENWGGIPLRWATELFLGRIPCPSESSRVKARISAAPEGGLRVEIPGEIFIYQFRNWGGQPWPEKLEWVGPKTRVEFTFDDPEDATSSPKKWEAKSPDGEVKVRWKDREVSTR